MGSKKIMLNKKGFTLIEILIVVAIIALLAGIVLVGLGPAQRGGNDVRRIADLNRIQTSLQVSYLRTGGYPAHGAGNTLPLAIDGETLPTTSVGQPIKYSSAGTTYTLGIQLDGSIPASTPSITGVSIGSDTCGASNFYCVASLASGGSTIVTCGGATCDPGDTCDSQGTAVTTDDVCVTPPPTCNTWQIALTETTVTTPREDIYTCTCTSPPGVPDEEVRVPKDDPQPSCS